MKKIIIIVGLLTLFTVSCVVPYSSYDYVEPTRYIYYPTYQPTKTIIVKQKHDHKHKSNKRHIKVKINKQHRKTK